VTDHAGALAVLLAPYADPDLQLVGRFVGVPPSVAEQALQLLLPEQRTDRLNLVHPPMTWLVQLADQMGGVLTGALPAGKAFVVFDGVQLAGAEESARELAERVAAAWPATDSLPGALAVAVAEAWPSWTATHPTWTGTGTDLLTAQLPPDTAVVGLWWS
jgi:hypothetical protein